MSTRHALIPRLAAIAFLVGTFALASAAVAQTCAYNSTQSTCACPTSGAGTTCFGGQLFRATDNSCQNDNRPCASNQVFDCTTVSCTCPSGSTLCPSSGACVPNRSCPTGTTWDVCTDTCNTPFVLLSPSFVQSGYIQINGDVKTTAGNLRLDSATGAGQGDTYIANGKAIRVDGSGVTSLSIGNWGTGGTSVNVFNNGNIFATGGLSTMPGDSSVAANTIETGNICFGNNVNCRSSWPTTTDFDSTYVNVTGDTMSGPLTLSGTNSLTVGGQIAVGGAALVSSTGASVKGTTYGVSATATDTVGYGVYGSGWYGVWGNSPGNGSGVSGISGGGGYGVYGQSATGPGVAGLSANTAGLFWDTASATSERLSYKFGTIYKGFTSGVSTLAPAGSIAGEFTNSLTPNTSAVLAGYASGVPYAGYFTGDVGITGKATVGSFNLASGAAAGRFLTSDASGNASWSTSPIMIGSGTTNYIPKFTGASTLGNSTIVDDGNNVTVTVGTLGTAALNGVSTASNGTGVGGRGNYAGAQFSATAAGGFGVIGTSASGPGVSGTSTSSNGGYFLSTSGNALYASSLGTGPAAVFQTGNVGIGTTAPAAKLHVTGGSLLVDGSTGAIPATGAGTRLMWYPGKEALRAGAVTGTAWDDASIGSGSMAVGDDTTASGVDSFAHGSGSVASGQYSTAGGLNSTATGNGTIAIGWGAHAAGGVGLGDNVYATGSDSVALGFASQATNTSATVSGYQSTGSGFASTAMGYNTTASGYAATAFGQSATAAGDRSVAMGLQNTANGPGSVALGAYNSTGTGGYATAVGYASSASGTFSFAGGYAATASGDQSFAYGQAPVASGYSSFSLGQYVNSTATYSSSFGDFINNTAYKSVTIGSGYDGTAGGMLANNVGYSIMLGAHSNLPTMTITSGLGIGTTGRVGIATTAPGAKLHVFGSASSGSASAQSGTNQIIQSGSNNYLSFLNTADNGTNAGIVMTDNNTGGYVDFHNYDGGALSDSMVYGAYQDHVFQAGSSDTINGKSEVMRIKQNGDVSLLGKHAFRANDSWLRLNQDGAFSSGTHTPGNFAPGALNVGGANGWGNPGSGNAWIAGNMVVYGSIYLAGWRSTWPSLYTTTNYAYLYGAVGWQTVWCPGGYYMTGGGGYNCQSGVWAGGCGSWYNGNTGMQVYNGSGNTAYEYVVCGTTN